MPTIPADWQRMEVPNKFAFYMPGDMRKSQRPGDHANAGGEFHNGHLVLTYAYGASDRCADSDGITQLPKYQRTETTAAGKQAVMRTSGPDRLGFYLVGLCFADIGDGQTSVTIGAMTQRPQDLDIAQQVFASVQFP